jgi:hypothetical protein
MCLVKILAFRTICVYVTNRRLCFSMQDLLPFVLEATMASRKCSTMTGTLLSWKELA